MKKLCVFFGAVVVFAAVVALFGERRVWGNSAEVDLKLALETVGQSEQFGFTTDLVQTEKYAARLVNIGRTDRTSSLIIDGAVDVSAETTTLDITSPDGGYRSGMKVENGIVWEKSADGTWEQSNQSTSLIAPNGNPLTYLTDANNIRYAATAIATDSDIFPAELLPADLALTRIAFDVNPMAFGAEMQEQIITQLKANNEWRNGMSLDNSMYADMEGVGEIWLNSADQTPTRMIVHLTQPQPNGNTIEARITTDFTDWTLRETIGFEFDLPTVTTTQIEAASTNAAILLLTLGGTALLIFYSRSRRLYAVFAFTLTGAFIFAPIAGAVASLDTQRFAQSVADRYAQAEEPEAEPQYEQTFHPNVDPKLATFAEKAPTLNTVLANNTNYQTGVDTDGDGLDDDVEIYRLGTDPGNVDTDGDTISDFFEVQGFNIDTETWYLNPLRADSNGDKVPDNLECIERVNMEPDGSINNNTLRNCRDTDNDFVPDIWDYDDDNDGVPDSADISPAYTGETGLRNSFNFELGSPTTGRYLETVVQVRPNTDSHLHLINNVYDWPANDTDGQHTRVKTDTFADYGFTDNQAANGDIRITPELEITIPWNAANPTRGLPISATVPINMATDPATFIDQAMLNRYRAGYVHDASNGTIVLTVPFSPNYDTVGDRIVGWQAFLPYQPQSASWGAAHQMRVTWKVTGLIDTCDPTAAPAGTDASTFCSATNLQNWTTQLATLNRYEVSFHLTGLTVREDISVDMALIADDDSLSQPYAQDLWHVADTLQRTFVEPSTIGVNGARLDVAEIARRLADGSSATATERWGIAADALNVNHITETSLNRAMSNVTATGLTGFLNAAFPARPEGATPTILIAQETSNRTVSIADGSTQVTWNGGTLTANFTGVDVQTMASLNMRPFTWTAADDWKAANLNTIMPGKQTAWNALFTDAALDSIAGPGLVAYNAARKGAVTMATNHYLALYTGQSGMVQTGNVLLEPTVLNDANYPRPAEPIFTLVQRQLADLFLLTTDVATVAIDGTTILLTGFQPVATVGAFLTQYGEVVIEQELTPAEWRGKRAATAFVAGAIAYLYAVYYGFYNFSNSTTGFNTGLVMLGALVLGAAFFLTAFILDRVGINIPGLNQAFQAVALSMFALSAIAEVGRTVRVLTHIRAAQQLISVADLVSDAGRTAAMVRYATNSLNAVRSAAITAAAVGFIIGVLIEIAFFLYSKYGTGLQEGTVEYDIAVARMLAGIVLAVLLLAIGLTMVLLGPVAIAVFAILMALLGIIEITLLIICQAVGFSPDHFTCHGVMGSLAQAIADRFYFYHVPLQLDHTDRLSMQIRGATLVDNTLGYRVGNQVSIGMNILNSQYPNPPDTVWSHNTRDFLINGYDMPKQILERAAYQYYLVGSQGAAPANTTSLYSQSWTKVGGNDENGYRLERTYVATGTATFLTPGMNRPISFYRVENATIPTLGCSYVISSQEGGSWYSCKDRHESFESVQSLGTVMSFDVLPFSFAGFVQTASVAGGERLAWDSRFPVIKDADGDGLLSQHAGGVDPDDGNVDFDGDGLTDYWELRNGFDPYSADPDNDNLIDYWEAFHDSDPFVPDTDSDGLIDSAEVFNPPNPVGSDFNFYNSWSGGWEVVYEYVNGVAQKTRVTSNPGRADSDADGQSDGYEFTFKFNPNAPYTIDPLKIERADLQIGTDRDGVVAANETFGYSMTVRNQLDTNVQSRGLVEGEFPEDNVQDIQSFLFRGQETLTMTGSLWADPARFTATEAVSATLRAGAYTEPVSPTITPFDIAATWPFDTLYDSGNPPFLYSVDRSGNNRTALCISTTGTTFLCPDFSNGYALLDTDDSIGATMALSGDLAVSVWVLPDPTATGQVHAIGDLIRDGLTNVVGLRVGNDGLSVYAEVLEGTDCTTTTTRTVSGGQLVANQWNHVVFTYDGATATMYVNGQAGAGVGVTSLCGDVQQVKLGAGFPMPSYTGGFRDVAVYDRGLDSAEIQREAASAYRLVELNFDEPPASTDFYDTRNLALKGTCTEDGAAGQPRCPLSGLSSINNRAVQFRSTLAHEFPDLIELDGNAARYGLDSNGSFTLMSWVKSDSWVGDQDIVMLADGRYGFKQVGFGVTNGNPVMEYWTGLAHQQYVANAVTLQPDTWHHVAWQYDRPNGTARLFVDGVLQLQTAASLPIDPTHSVLLGGGHYALSTEVQYKYVGQLDHFVIVNRVMDSAEIQAIMDDSPQLNLHFDRDSITTGFLNSSVADINATCTPSTGSGQGNCPTPGAIGKMREAPIFANGDSLSLSGTDLPGVLDANHAVMMWLMPTLRKDTAQTIFSNGTYSIGLTPELNLTYCEAGISYTTFGALALDNWRHVAVGRTDGVSTFYLDGQPAATSAPVGDGCSVGATQIGGDFDGRIDELAMYSGALVSAEITALYDYQLRWFDSRQRFNVLVDTEGPDVQILAPAYMSNASGQRVFITAHDTGIGVDGVFAQISASFAPGFNPILVDTTEGYIVEIPVGFLAENHTITLRIIATDHLNNNSVTDATIAVDVAPPVATLTTPPTLTQHDVTLTGTITDDLSGVDATTLQVRLLENGVAVSTYQTATLTGDSWTATIPSTTPLYGNYSVQLIADDMVGNSLDAVVGSVDLDSTLPFAAILSTNTIISSATNTIGGFASTIPYPDQPVLHLPLDEPAGATQFGSVNNNDQFATCTSCPTAGATGQNGNATTFAPGNQLSFTRTLTSAKGTLMFHLQPGWANNANGFDPILATSGNATIRATDDRTAITIHDGTTTQTYPFAQPLNTFYHFALVSDGTSVTVYQDGLPTATMTQTVELGLPLSIGAAAQGFAGTLDDVLLSNEALDADTIYDIANPISGSIQSVEVGLKHSKDAAPTWRTVTPDSTTSNYTDWSYTIPDAIEGPYHIEVRVTETDGITNYLGIGWNGLIDTVAPRLTLQSSGVGGGNVNVVCSAEDQYLIDTTWDCTAPTTPTPSYETATWYTTLISEPLLTRLDNTETIAAQPLSLTACDYVGQCSTETINALDDLQIADIPGVYEYQLIYKLTPPADAFYFGAQPPYEVDNAAQIGTFDRVGYYLELENANERQWIFVSMDAFTTNAAATGVPVSNTFEQNVSNLQVLSNVPGVTTGGPFATGNLEFWSNCYGVSADSNIGGDGSIYDFDDTPDGAPNCYGSMQVHHGAVGETLFAWNRWTALGGNDDIGIGNSPTIHPDWTLAQTSGNWITRTLYVLARPTAAANPDNYEYVPGVPLTVPAAGVLANDGTGLTATLVNTPTNGTVTLNPDGSFTFDGSATSVEQFIYAADDGHFLSQEATVTLTPVAANCFVETNGDAITDGYSSDATALRTAVAAAAPGATIKVAGTLRRHRCGE